MLSSLLIEGLAISIFPLIVEMQPHIPVKPPKAMMVTPLVAPPEFEPPAPPAHVHIPRPVLPATPPKIEMPQLAATREPPPEIPQPKLAVPKTAEARPVPAPPAPLPQVAVVHPPDFSTGSSAKPTVKLPERKVQTGGFGDPEGFPGKAEGGSKGNVAKLGSFDLPAGPGHGNGTGGAAGVPGVVASAGFGNGVAVQAGNGGGRTVQSSGFGDAASGGSGRKTENQPVTPDFVPAMVISKPNPVYPAEAKQMRLEGEVLLSVLFQATGQVRVLRVVRGLGHGMDEAAERAAKGIQFKPARRDGQPVDMQAVVHIIFQLAY